MNKQSKRTRQQQAVKSIAPVRNDVRKPVRKPSALWEGRFIVLGNHAKVGVHHFSV